MLLFKDDAVLFAHTESNFQSLIKDVQRYCNKWGLTINVNKSKVMVFEREKKQTCDIRLGNS